MSAVRRLVDEPGNAAQRILDIDRRLPKGDGDVELPCDVWEQLVEDAHRDRFERDEEADRLPAQKSASALLGVLRWELQRVESGQPFRNAAGFLKKLGELGRLHSGITTQGECQDMARALGIPLAGDPGFEPIPPPRKKRAKKMKVGPCPHCGDHDHGAEQCGVAPSDDPPVPEQVELDDAIGGEP